MDTTAAFSKFANKWLSVGKIVPASLVQIEEVERELGLRLPQAYRLFVLTYGTPATYGLLSSLVKGDKSIQDLQEFIELEQLLEQTEAYESGGMQAGFIGFAMDCMANMFLFKKEECVGVPLDSPVWFFDHDFLTVEKVAEGFTEWISRYAEISRIES